MLISQEGLLASKHPISFKTCTSTGAYDLLQIDIAPYSHINYITNDLFHLTN